MKSLGKPLIFKSLSTCFHSRSFSVSHDGMLSARSIRHLTTVGLLWAGLWEVKSKYLMVWVALRCTLTTTLSDRSTVLRVSRKAMVWLLGDDDSTKDKKAVNERKPFPSVYKTLIKPQGGTMILFKWQTHTQNWIFYSEAGCSCNQKFRLRLFFI